MKKPRKAPALNEVWAKLGGDHGRIAYLLSQVADATMDGRYLHWDKLKYYPPPGGLSHEEWWSGLKVRRMQSKQVPLKSTDGTPFSFNLVDPLPERLHHIDSLARGVVQMPEPVTNPDTSKRYLIRSLIEEAITSSQLEGSSTTRDVAKKMIQEGRKPRDRNEQMIYNNYKAMQFIIDIKNQNLTKELVFHIHRIVTEDTLNQFDGAGRFRRSEENIVVGDDTGEVFHEPPPADQLENRMEEMCRFANRETPGGFIHPMVRSMILHFWLAYDHPFIDGNGRTARALFYWSMLRNGYFLFEFISISNMILHSPAKYGRAFLETETDENDLTYFLLYHTDITNQAIAKLYDYIEDRTNRIRTAEAELRGLTMLNHRQRDLISHALRHPGHRYDIETHRNSQNVVYETARSDLIDLERRKLFVKRKVGKSYHFIPAVDIEERLRK